MSTRKRFSVYVEALEYLWDDQESSRKWRVQPLQAALNIEDGLEDLRYNNIVMRPMPMWTVCTFAYSSLLFSCNFSWTHKRRAPVYVQPLVPCSWQEGNHLLLFRSRAGSQFKNWEVNPKSPDSRDWEKFLQMSLSILLGRIFVLIRLCSTRQPPLNNSWSFTWEKYPKPTRLYHQ